MGLDEVYEQKRKRSSDINEHLPTLKKYAERVDYVTEIGIRDGCSIYAFLAARPKKVVAYDILKRKGVYDVERIAEEAGVDFTFYKGDSLEVEIDRTDILFIDTLHTYDQLRQELALHGNKSNKYIICHDTQLYKRRGAKGGNKGLMDAIEDFMEKNSELSIKEHFTNNNGLTILEK